VIDPGPHLHGVAGLGLVQGGLDRLERRRQRAGVLVIRTGVFLIDDQFGAASVPGLSSLAAGFLPSTIRSPAKAGSISVTASAKTNMEIKLKRLLIAVLIRFLSGRIQ
jgi:hypothetical protein